MYRFGGMLSEFPARHLADCLAEDADRADAIIALSEAINHDVAVIALGTLARATEGSLAQAELGLLVRDDWQGQGVGTTLLAQLLHRASRRSVRAVEAQVLNSQRWLVFWLQDHTRVIDASMTREVTTIVFELDPID